MYVNPAEKLFAVSSLNDSIPKDLATVLVFAARRVLSDLPAIILLKKIDLKMQDLI